MEHTLSLVLFEHYIGGHGNQQQRHRQRECKSSDDGDTNVLAYEAYEHLVREDEGQEYGDCRKRRSDNGFPHFARTLRNSLFGTLSVREEPVNILEDDYTIIEQHSYCKSHSYECEAINRNIAIVEYVKRRQYGDRHRQCNEEHQTDVAQEKPQYYYCKQCSADSKLDHLVDVSFNFIGRIGLHDKLNLLRHKLFVKSLEAFLCPVRKLDEIHLCIVHKRHRDCLFSINAAEGSLFLQVKEDGGNILQIDGTGRHNHIFNFGNVVVVGIQMHIVTNVGRVYVTEERTLLIVLRKNIPDTCGGKFQCSQCILVYLNLDSLFASAIYVHSRNAVDIFELRLNIFIDNRAQPVYSARATHLQSHKVVVHAIDVCPFDVHRKAIGQRRKHTVHPLL